MDAIVAEGVWVPKDRLGRYLETVRNDLTIRIWDGENTQYLHTLVEHDDWVLLPRSYGLGLLARLGIDWEDSRATGHRIADECKVVKLRDYQIPFVNDLVDEAARSMDFMAKAMTGGGKTVMALEAARRLGRTTLIVVDQELLLDQWVERIGEHLGIPAERVGIIQGKTLEYDGYSFVVGMLQTLYRRRLPEDVYTYFGTVIFDECHTCGPEKYSQVLLQFPAVTRFGITATPRDDSYAAILHNNLGSVAVELSERHDKSIVRYAVSNTVVSWYANISPKAGRFVNEIAGCTDRNWLIVYMIMSLYESGRDILVVSDRTEHLENLLAMCIYQGIPEQDMGLVTGYRSVWRYDKDPTPKSVPDGWSRGVDYTAVKYTRTKQKVPRKELQYIKDSKQIVFATYGMFRKGVDVPRLSAGIDCTPRAKAEQVHGRILRVVSGKPTPIWATIRDRYSFRSEFQLMHRLQEYAKSNVEIQEWRVTKTTSKVRKVDQQKLLNDIGRNIQQLKSRKIRQDAMGRNLPPIK